MAMRDLQVPEFKNPHLIKFNNCNGRKSFLWINIINLKLEISLKMGK